MFARADTIMSDDPLIRSATIYDGSGGEPFVADLAARGGRIRPTIGKSLPVDAARVIDAGGSR